MPEQDDSTQDPNPVAQLRDQLEKERKESAAKDERLAALERKEAFRDAGVDLASPVGQLLLDAWKDDLDPEAIRARAEEVGALSGSAPPPAREEPAPPDQQDQTRQRQALAGESTAPDVSSDRNPYLAGITEFNRAMAEGRTREDASIGAFHEVLQAAANGDPRVFVED